MKKKTVLKNTIGGIGVDTVYIDELSKPTWPSVVEQRNEERINALQNEISKRIVSTALEDLKRYGKDDFFVTSTPSPDASMTDAVRHAVKRMVNSLEKAKSESSLRHTSLGETKLWNTEPMPSMEEIWRKMLIAEECTIDSAKISWPARIISEPPKEPSLNPDAENWINEYVREQIKADLAERSKSGKPKTQSPFGEW